MGGGKDYFFPPFRSTLTMCSLAGLLAARVCHDHFKRVAIIEPEPWLATEESRIPQAWTQRQDRSRIIQYHSVLGMISKLIVQVKMLQLLRSASYKSGRLQGVVSGF